MGILQVQAISLLMIVCLITPPAECFLGDVFRDVGRGIGNAANHIGRTAVNVGRHVGRFGGDVGRHVGRIGSNVGRTTVNVARGVGDFGEDIVDGLGDIFDEIGRGLKNFLEDTIWNFLIKCGSLESDLKAVLRCINEKRRRGGISSNTAVNCAICQRYNGKASVRFERHCSRNGQRQFEWVQRHRPEHRG